MWHFEENWISNIYKNLSAMFKKLKPPTSCQILGEAAT